MRSIWPAEGFINKLFTSVLLMQASSLATENVVVVYVTCLRLINSKFKLNYNPEYF